MMFTCNPLRKVRGSSFVLVVISFVLAALLVGCPTPGDDTPTPPDPVDTVTPPDTMAAPTLEAGNRHLLVAWSAPADNGGSEITAYELRHSDDGGNTWSGLIEIPAPATETIITGLTNLTPYTVQARARNSAGAGDWSESSAEATPIVVSLAPTAFTLTAEDTIITATWAAPTDTGGSAIIRYELQHREVGASAWEPAIATADADTLTLSITDLTKGAEYEARVYAVNGQGNGNPTEIKKATIPATKPSAMNAPALTVGDTQLTATWTAPDDGGSTITAYEVLYKVSTASGWTQDNETIAGTAVSYTITGLTNGSRWQVRVRAVNEVGDGGWSASAVKRLLPSATQVPSGGTAASVILSATIDDAIANAENPSVTVAGLTSGTSVTLPTVGSSTGVITVTAMTTAGIYVVSGLDGGGNELFPSEKFYVTANPQTNAKLVTAVTEGIDTWGNTADFNYIVTTAVTNMNGVFLSKSSFNGDISGWDTGAVTTMYRMFRDAHVFNGDISGWDVSKVTTMRWMFRDARVFNGDISGWDTGAVTNMSTMFNKAFLFNGDISGWDVSKVTDMSLMFTGASAFNGNISGWDVSSVTDMSSMFLDASAFNQNLENWGTHLTGRTVDKTSMFAGSGLDGTEPSWY